MRSRGCCALLSLDTMLVQAAPASHGQITRHTTLVPRSSFQRQNDQVGRFRFSSSVCGTLMPEGSRPGKDKDVIAMAGRYFDEKEHARRVADISYLAPSVLGGVGFGQLKVVTDRLRVLCWWLPPLPRLHFGPAPEQRMRGELFDNQALIAAWMWLWMDSACCLGLAYARLTALVAQALRTSPAAPVATLVDMLVDGRDVRTWWRDLISMAASDDFVLQVQGATDAYEYMRAGHAGDDCKAYEVFVTEWKTLLGFTSHLCTTADDFTQYSQLLYGGVTGEPPHSKAFSAVFAANPPFAHVMDTDDPAWEATPTDYGPPVTPQRSLSGASQPAPAPAAAPAGSAARPAAGPTAVPAAPAAEPAAGAPGAGRRGHPVARYGKAGKGGKAKQPTPVLTGLDGALSFKDQQLVKGSLLALAAKNQGLISPQDVTSFASSVAMGSCQLGATAKKRNNEEDTPDRRVRQARDGNMLPAAGASDAHAQLPVPALPPASGPHYHALAPAVQALPANNQALRIAPASPNRDPQQKAGAGR